MRRLLKLWGALPIHPRIRWALVTFFVPKFAVGVAGVILNEQNEILLFHHTYRGNRFPWGLPGGWLDPREDPAQGIVREIREESGLEVCVVRPLLIENALIFRHLNVIFLCKMVGGTFRPSNEVDAIQFFGQRALPEMMLSQYAVIEKIFDLIHA